MEKNGKELKTSRNRSYFVMKVLLLVLCVVVVVLFAVVAKGFASLKALNKTLKALNKRLNAMEEEKSLGFKSLRSEKHEHGTRRSKRSVAEMEFKKAMVKLEKLEGR